ncbi:IclR family transcriptional regulator [Martelella mediterranea]|uniref:IclR family transcriptional regulator n=1 Tax=Martelella mediterranea TaxID=293089 RepID=A0A4R3NCH3_9HYPH|nr:IclR family transcriptional regulator [Martelella mediterranea]
MVLSKSSEIQTEARNAEAGNQVASVPALRRTVLILDLIANVDAPMSAAEITRSLKLPKSTVHGLLTVMMELALIVRNSDGTYRIGPHTMRWANGFLSKMDIVSIFNEYFAQDTAFRHYTMTLTVLDHRDVVYIGCRNSDQPLGQTFRIGMRLPAPFTATGKILLSEMSEARLRHLFDSEFPAAMTSRSAKNLEQLMVELAATRERGFSIDDGQVSEGMICIGSAVRDHTGQIIAGIATSLMRTEASIEVVSDMGKTIGIAANNLSQQLGGK